MAQQKKQATAKRGKGRPPVGAKTLDDNLNFNCASELVAAVEVYRRKHFLKSEAEACREALAKGLRADGIKFSA